MVAFMPSHSELCRCEICKPKYSLSPLATPLTYLQFQQLVLQSIARYYGIPKHIMLQQSKFQTVLQGIADRDVETLVKKDAEYGSSWKKRGGVGAFMMLARKWDRLETQVTRPGLDSKYDVFDAIGQDASVGTPRQDQATGMPLPPVPTESVLETIRDLRRYLLLVESEIMLRKAADNYQSQPIVQKEWANPNTQLDPAVDPQNH